MISILSVQQGPGHGAETVLGELLRAWPREDEPLAVIAPAGSAVYAAAEASGHRTISFPASRDAVLPNWRAGGAVAEELAGARRVHAWAARGFEGARRLADQLGVPCTGTLHDHPRAAFHGRVRRVLMRRAANRFDGLVCVSDAVRAACGEAGYRCRLEVVRNGLADAPVRTGESKTVRLGFLGMYAAWKGFGVVAGWARELAGSGVEWRLYGEVGPALAGPAAALAADPGLKVTLCGRRPPTEIFADVDVLIHASSGFDPLPTVLIEAARAGVPSVACDHGGAREIVVNGETGFLFPVSDPGLGLKKLRELITDSDLRARQSTAARRRFEGGFRVDRMVREYGAFWSAGPSGDHAAE